MSELLKINVNDHTEKKGQLTYLSWAWAWAKVLEIDPLATWEAVEFNGLPVAYLPDESALVKTVVTIKNHSKSCWLPVMDNRNKSVKNPDSFAVNTALVRCLTKCISMHGLGLYIYAGEDLPDGEDAPKSKSALAGIGDDLPEDWKIYLKDLATELTNMVASGDIQGAKDRVSKENTEGNLEDDMGVFMHRHLDSKTRSAISTRK